MNTRMASDSLGSYPVDSYSRPIPTNNTEECPLVTIDGTHQVSQGTIKLLKEIGGGDTIRSMCARFYAKAFKDSVLHKFQFMTDGAEAHGKRLGDWIAEKMGGEGKPWSSTRPRDSRTNSHRQAWHCEKREPEKRGNRFKLDDCVIWMRLMFWSAREEGLDKNNKFWKWYVQFIAHFIGVYEFRAPSYAVAAANWSGNQDNVVQYLKDGCKMVDVLSWQSSQSGH
eukprot:TRINITY_DN39461_c0_g1_i1.p1 TRINITY_DN39461_c0_g1~~TRINITY_DN39461_c0_g1_i1.p1  ORF type:complete len:225 (-),score=33.73 TRINITY_DN39461_c0_g1_i1:120-794(-)